MLTQVALPLGDRPAEAEVTKETLAKQRDMLAAINLAAYQSGLEDKQMYSVLEVAKSTWSRMLSGSYAFPAQKLDSFCDVVGNDIALEWLTQKRGYKLVKLKSTLEEENELLRLEVADLKRDKQTILEFAKSLK